MKSVWSEFEHQEVGLLAEKLGADDALMGDGWDLGAVVLLSTVLGFYPDADQNKVMAWALEKGHQWWGDLLGNLSEQVMSAVETDLKITNIFDLEDNKNGE